ncbi:hypothetical protein FRACA_1410002 [Frankia canadensis]|uniref:Uncharacterized protein n=1 Tax=Frankia canadensis TaxID=1836972 RepID=A0A2I2KLE9_9ACTN|nr:hypothetical protein FRACA_1410002 [Frankia canadensis]SOU53773.1 hypothetical protein FRACA_1410002 [Frankia canadensis]
MRGPRDRGRDDRRTPRYLQTPQPPRQDPHRRAFISHFAARQPPTPVWRWFGRPSKTGNLTESFHFSECLLLDRFDPRQQSQGMTGDAGTAREVVPGPTERSPSALLREPTVGLPGAVIVALHGPDLRAGYPDTPAAPGLSLMEPGAARESVVPAVARPRLCPIRAQVLLRHLGRRRGPDVATSVPGRPRAGPAHNPGA